MAEPLQVGIENLPDYQLSSRERRYRNARKKPTALELQRPFPEKWSTALAALQELRKQLAEQDPMLDKIAKRGVWVFTWPELTDGGPNLGFDIKNERGRGYRAYGEALVTETGIQWANVDWHTYGTCLRISSAGPETPPPQALLFALDTIAEAEIAVQKSERVYRNVHYLGITDPAHRTYIPPAKPNS